jgi:small subunit ribosomal protein S25e
VTEKGYKDDGSFHPFEETTMGGKKKLTLKQMEKSEAKKTTKKEKRATAAPAEKKKSVPGISPPSLADDKLVGELKKLKVLTPYSVASRFELRMSTARGFLRDLERKGLVEFVSKSRNLKIYKPVD